MKIQRNYLEWRGFRMSRQLDDGEWLGLLGSLTYDRSIQVEQRR
jgi:hypothetical protein